MIITSNGSSQQLWSVAAGRAVNYETPEQSGIELLISESS